MSRRVPRAAKPDIVPLHAGTVCVTGGDPLDPSGLAPRGPAQNSVQVQFVGRRQAGPLAEDLGTEVALIQALIPLGLEAVHDVLRREVEALAGPSFGRVWHPLLAAAALRLRP